MRFFRDSIARRIAFTVGLCTIALLCLLFLWMNRFTDALDSKNLLPIAAAGVAAVLSVVILNLWIVNRFFAGPLGSLVALMSSVEKGNFLVRSKPSADNDEIAVLGRSFNKMLVTITDLTADQLEKERELVKAQEESKYKESMAEKGRELIEANRSLETRVKELSLLFEIGKTINSTLEIDEILRRITDLLGREMKYEQFAILLMDESGESLTARAAFGFSNVGEDGGSVVFARGEGICWTAAESAETVLIPDTRLEPRYLYYKGRQKNEGAVLMIPMMHQRACVGVMNFVRPLGLSFPRSEIDFLTMVANQAAMAIVNGSLHRKTVELTITDSLTGVYNRRYLDRALSEEIESARRYGSDVSIILIDIDHFKTFNDILGHAAGDRALRSVASLIAQRTRRVDTVARYGGEEFCVVLPNTGRQAAEDVAEKLRKAIMSTPFQGASRLPFGRLTISLGVAVFPHDSNELQGVVDAADVALYHAKNGGRNSVSTYTPGMSMPRRDEGR